MFVLTPAEAIAVAALIDCDKRLAATWRDVAARLRAWGQQQPQTEHEEGEMPSQTGFSGRETGTLGSETEAVPEVRKHQGDLTASTSTERTGGRGL